MGVARSPSDVGGGQTSGEEKRTMESRRRDAGYIRRYIYTYGNGFTTGLRYGGIQAMPAGQEVLDVRSSDIHDAKARDVDGAKLDHLALPSVVHYLITAKHTGY